MPRALRRHHRARRLAAVTRRAQTIGGDIDSDHERRFLRMSARTRTLCSCFCCKSTRRENAAKQAVELGRQFREQVADVETWGLTYWSEGYGPDDGSIFDGYDGHVGETREMLDEYAEIQRIFSALAPFVRANGGAWSPFGESGYADYEWPDDEPTPQPLNPS